VATRHHADHLLGKLRFVSIAELGFATAERVRWRRGRVTERNSYNFGFITGNRFLSPPLSFPLRSEFEPALPSNNDAGLESETILVFNTRRARLSIAARNCQQCSCELTWPTFGLRQWQIRSKRDTLATQRLVFPSRSRRAISNMARQLEKGSSGVTKPNARNTCSAHIERPILYLRLAPSLPSAGRCACIRKAAFLQDPVPEQGGRSWLSLQREAMLR